MMWFIVQLDRNFLTGTYGMGSSYYVFYTNEDVDEENSYSVSLKSSTIKFNEYIEAENKLVITLDHQDFCDKETKHEKISLIGEPNIALFNKTLYKDWELWDSNYGKYQGEDRADYKPWIFETTKDIVSSGFRSCK